MNPELKENQFVSFDYTDLENNKTSRYGRVIEEVNGLVTVQDETADSGRGGVRSFRRERIANLVIQPQLAVVEPPKKSFLRRLFGF